MDEKGFVMSSQVQTEILAILSLLEVQAVSCGKTRIGGANDGGYVMANDLERNSIAYSIGVGPQVQWDIEMANRGLEIHQYDHTVPGLPSEHPNFHYNKLGIGPDLSQPDLITLDEMLVRNGHSENHNMLLKIDVEGAEWDVFEAMDHDLLKRFDQIIIEFHGFEFMTEQSYRDRCKRVFRKLTYHHNPIHVHANNYAPLNSISGVAVASVLEMTFCLRSRFYFEKSDEIFPTELDQPCRSDQPDIFLGRFKFKRIPS
jgi:hypothetical protein